MENSSSGLEFYPCRRTALCCDVQSQEKSEMNKILTKRVSLGETVELKHKMQNLKFLCAQNCVTLKTKKTVLKL